MTQALYAHMNNKRKMKKRKKKTSFWVNPVTLLLQGALCDQEEVHGNLVFVFSQDLELVSTPV
jgi:hypothetical protein